MKILGHVVARVCVGYTGGGKVPLLCIVIQLDAIWNYAAATLHNSILCFWELTSAETSNHTIRYLLHSCMSGEHTPTSTSKLIELFVVE